jgi:DNA invertase Pin-like site-specific DNA recombinase
MPAVRAAAYARSSDDKQEASCPQQREWAVRKAAALGMELAAYHEDDGIPGDRLDRPGLEALFADLGRQQKARRPVPVLLLFDQDRLSRATSWATGAIMERLMGLGVERLVTATEEVDLYDDGDRAIYGLKQDLTKRGYAKALSKNVSRAMPQYAAAGCWTGGVPPYAYRVTGEARHRRLVPGPQEEVEAARELFRLAAEGFLSTWALARLANERGWPVPTASVKRQLEAAPGCAPVWTASTVGSLLRQPAYVGTIRYGRRRKGKYHQATADGPVEKRGPSQARAPAILRENCHEPLIDRAVWDRVQALMDARRVKIKPDVSPNAQRMRERRRNRQRKGTRRPEQFLFRGKLTCACCGAPMQGRNQDDFHGYVCGTWRNHRGCSRNGVHEAELLDRVAELLVKELDSPATLKGLRERLEAKRGEGRDAAPRRGKGPGARRRAATAGRGRRPAALVRRGGPPAGRAEGAAPAEGGVGNGAGRPRRGGTSGRGDPRRGGERRGVARAAVVAAQAAQERRPGKARPGDATGRGGHPHALRGAGRAQGPEAVVLGRRDRDAQGAGAGLRNDRAAERGSGRSRSCSTTPTRPSGRNRSRSRSSIGGENSTAMPRAAGQDRSSSPTSRPSPAPRSRTRAASLGTSSRSVASPSVLWGMRSARRR